MIDITVSDIEDAALRLEKLVVRTPLHEADFGLSSYGRVFLKLETNQVTGSFKFRGAYNMISQLDGASLRAGVVAYSSGNHAQAVACVAKILGTKAVIVMPSDAPKKKIEATKGYDAEVILYDRWKESREDIAIQVVNERKMTLVPPFDHPMVISGQGTAGLEIVQDLNTLNIKPDLVLVPASGGGLVSGVSIAIKNTFPNCAIFCVEPKHFDDISLSLSKGKRVTNQAPTQNSICDALLVPTPGELTFEIMRKFLEGGLTVSDEAVARAMRRCWLENRIILEPGGAVAVAAIIEKIAPKAAVTVALCSGGNIDEENFKRLIKGAKS